MEKSNTLQNWESLVQKQMKTNDIYPQLSKENLEGIRINPFYASLDFEIQNLPKVEDSIHLVSLYHSSLEEEVYAFLLHKEEVQVSDKSLFINDKDLAKNINIQKENKYFSLVDIISDKDGSIDKEVAKILLNKGLNRNLTIDISLHQNSGAAIYQQLGIALAKTKILLNIFGEDILRKVIFKIAIGSNYFFEIAKIRALKLLFNRFSQECGLNEIPYIFAETTLRNKSKHDEENNLIRSTLEIAAAMIGGADAVFANDYKLENNTELSAEIAFKQQIVLAYESIINVFEDGIAGSYYVEDITQQIAKKSWTYYEEIETEGGYSELLKKGKIQKDIYEQALQEQLWVEEGKIKLIGVNLYPRLNQTKSPLDLYAENEIKPVRLSEMFE